MYPIILLIPLYTGQTSKGGFYMKYNHVLKLNCIELYKNGQCLETPEEIEQRKFRKRIITWLKIAETHGIAALKHPTTCSKYTAEERYYLIA